MPSISTPSFPQAFPQAPVSLIEKHGKHIGAIERVRDISPEAFRERYMKGAKAVILEGAMDSWPCLSKWSFDFFRENYGDAKIPVGVVFEKLGEMRLGDYIDYLQEREEQAQRGEALDLPKYLEGWYFKPQFPELAEDCGFPTAFGEDWFKKYFPKRYDPDGLGVLIGPRGAFTKLHYDGQSTHNMLAQIRGRKQWVVVAPEQLTGVFADWRESAGGYPGIDHPKLEDYPRLTEIEYQTAVVEPGDVIFIPSRFYHQVRTLEASISLTYNFFNGTVARRVLWEMFLLRLKGFLRLS